MDAQAPIVNTYTPPVEPQLPTSPVVPKTNWGISILFLILGVLIGAAGFWGYQKYLPFLSNQPINYPSSTPVATPDPTANWKTHWSQKLGITFKYPSDKISITDDGDRITVKRTGLFNLIYFDISPDSDFCGPGEPITKNPEVTSMTIEGKSYPVRGCIFASGGPSGGGSITSYVANINTNLKIVILKEYEYTNDLNGKIATSKRTSQEDIDLANQILSTFKFLGQGSTTDTSNWKTYTSASLGISIKYPPSWFIESETTDNTRIQNYDPSTAPGRGYDPITDKGKFAFQIYRSKFTNNPTTIDQLKSVLSKSGEACSYMGDPAGTTVITNEIIQVVNGYQSYTRTQRCSQLPESAAYTVTYIINGKGEIVSFGKLLDIASETTTFSQILSTFKFTQ